MRILSLIFLLVGLVCTALVVIQMFQEGVRGDRLLWVKNGAFVVATFSLVCSLALFLVDRKQRKK